jgi:hypothetical protein
MLGPGAETARVITPVPVKPVTVSCTTTVTVKVPAVGVLQAM